MRNIKNIKKLFGFMLIASMLFAGTCVAAENTAALDLGNGVDMKFALIPAGTYTRGSPSSEEGRARAEVQHEVTITKPFYMGIYLVTQAQYEAVMGKNPTLRLHIKQGEETLHYPVNVVSWEEAVEFCRLLSEKTGRTVRLPTEAEWEYACRAGTTTAFYFGETITDEQANFGQSQRDGQITPVGAYPPNAWGLYDMHGNLMEWCSDFNARYGDDPLTDPQGPATGRNRVHRGGAYSSSLPNVRSAFRANSSPGVTVNHIGFRVVMEQ